MDSLLSLQVFNTVAATKSFSAAAEQLDISAAMATKHVQNIEARIGARLLNRTSRKVSLTEAGEIYLSRVRALLEGLEEAEGLIGESTVVPRGTLKISLPIWMGTPSFVKKLASYHERYPEVKLNLDLSANFVNLVEEAYDLALRVGNYGGDGLIARKLMDIRFVAVASPEFVKKNGLVNTLDDFNGIPFLAYTPMSSGDQMRIRNNQSEWTFPIDPVVKSENETFILLSALEGMGVAILPDLLVDEHIKSGRLQRLMPDQIEETVSLLALYPDRNYLPAKTRSFIDFMLSP
jgi:DNA-binding transcriptional LysR family regulator